MSARAATAQRPSSRRVLRRVAIVAGILLLLASILATPALFRRTEAPVIPDNARAPEGVRVRVQVLNATDIRGLARHGTRHLRDHGFDVVDMGNAREELDSTRVIDRSGHPDWAERVARAVGGARVESQPDTSRYLDVTVLLGRSYRPPPEPFHP